jgi:hypothetical protein
VATPDAIPFTGAIGGCELQPVARPVPGPARLPEADLDEHRDSMTGDARTWMSTVESGVADPPVNGAVVDVGLVDVGPIGGTSTNGDTGERKGRRPRLPLLRRFVGRGREDGDRAEEAEDQSKGTGLNGHGVNGNGANTNRTGPVDHDPGRPTLFDELGNDGFHPVKAPPWEVVGVTTVTGRSGPGR